MWIYKNTLDNSARFVLGEKGEKPLICFGINPSTAEPNNLDQTLRRVRSISQQKNFDGWIMLNLYPQRTTDPNNLHQSLNTNIHKINLKHIKSIFHNNPKSAIWAAWGNLINRRKFLKQCLKDIINVAEPYSIRWFRMGNLLTQGHPHHPLYLRNDAQFLPFNMDTYLKI